MSLDLIPGQMYAWHGIGTIKTWLITYVTEEGRTVWIGGRHGFINAGDLFTVVSLDDEGPYDGPDFGDSFVQVSNPPSNAPLVARKVNKRWHTALLHDAIFWLDHELLETSELVSDAV